MSDALSIHVVTADTFGRAVEEVAGLPLQLVFIGNRGQAEAKLALVRELGLRSVVAIGNGRNDRKMLGAVALGIGSCSERAGRR